MTPRREIEIIPEPTSEERAAIEAVLAPSVAEPSAERGAWWRAGVADDSADDEAL